MVKILTEPKDSIVQQIKELFLLDKIQIEFNIKEYNRELSHITGNNKLSVIFFECKIRKNKTKKVIEIWNVKFHVTKFEETCNHKGFEIKNTYYIDHKEIVRRSSQYHSKTLGYIITERLDR